MLVSPHVGGGAKLAMAIHKHAVSSRGPVSQLMIPPGGDAERVSREEGLAYVGYSLEWLGSTNSMRSLVANSHLYLRLQRYGAGVIHIHSPFVYGSARLFLMGSRLKRVLHVHLNFTADDLRWALMLPPDLIFVCADFMRPAVERALPKGKMMTSKIRVLLNGVDTNCFFPIDRQKAKVQLGINPGMPFLVVVANLAPHKGQETAIRAVALMRSYGRDVKLWVVGKEREEGRGYLEYLKVLSGQLRVDDLVEYVGFRNDIPDLLRAADFLLLPSTSEGLPLSILEAQASKAIVLAAPTAGIPEVIDTGHTGFLIPAQDYEGYAQQILCLIGNEDVAQCVREVAFKQVTFNFGLERYCERVLQEYDFLLNNA